MIILFTLLKIIVCCNPLKDWNCLVKNEALNNDLLGITSVHYNTKGDVRVGEETEMVMNKRLDNPMIESQFSILYGKVSCDIKAATGSGIITSFYLQSNDLDEIDVAEIFGNNAHEFQSNFFIKGNTTTWDRGIYHSIPDPFENFNRYTVEWTPHEIVWFINDQLVRRLKVDNQYGIPKSPMQVKLSLWAGGDPGNSRGTILWAGGVSDYASLPYTMKVKNMMVTDYSSGKYYTYGHENGQWIKLKSVGGVVGGRLEDIEFDVEPDGFLDIEERSGDEEGWKEGKEKSKGKKEKGNKSNKSEDNKSKELKEKKEMKDKEEEQKSKPLNQPISSAAETRQTLQTISFVFILELFIILLYL